MEITLSTNKKQLIIQSKSIQDYNFLKKFPGFIQIGNELWACPAKPHVTAVLFNRLKEHYKKPINISKEVVEYRKFVSENFKELPESFTYYTNPLEHQHLALQHLWARRKTGLLLDPGLGKTKIILDFIFLLKEHSGEPFGKALIVCPKALLFVWERETKKHRPELKTHVVDSVSYGQQIETIKRNIETAVDPKVKRDYTTMLARVERKREAENKALAGADVIVLNYDKAVIAADKLANMKWSFMAIDEGLIKDPKSLRTEKLTLLGKKIPNRTIMSGTLVNNGPEDVFSPIRYLEPAVLGESFYNFNQHYGIYVGKTQENKRGFLVGYKGTKDIYDSLHAVSLVMRKDEWLPGLPKKKFFKVTVGLSEAQQTAYEEMATNYITKVRDEFVEVDNPLSCLAKLAQISSGFLYLNESDTEFVDIGLKIDPKKKKRSKKRSIDDIFFFKDQPKVDKLRELLTTTLAKRKVVIWYNCNAEAFLIERLLKELGSNFRVIRGGTPNAGECITDFNEDPTVQYLLCQAKAVNYGVTLLGTDIESMEYEPEITPEVFTHVFYSMNYSLEVFLQQQDRSHRIGMKFSPEYWILYADAQIDQDMNDKLVSKEEIRETFLVDTLKRHTNGKSGERTVKDENSVFD